MNGFIVSAPHSGSGKTLVTLGLVRAFANKGLNVSSAKAGPDYIDPAFHAAASGRACVNLDPWAMRSETLSSLAYGLCSNSELLVVESMMGLYDGAADGSASSADLAGLLGMPVVFVVDASRMSYSVAALVKGFRDHCKSLEFAGVILNRVGSDRHESMLRSALESEGITVLGVVPAVRDLEMPSRHLGLVQAGEIPQLETFITTAADQVAQSCDIDALRSLRMSLQHAQKPTLPSPLGQRIAIARDEAFAFCYPHLVTGWQDQGAEVSFFSPLADEAPNQFSDAVFLPGGYPELHASKLANAKNFMAGLRSAKEQGNVIYGECGGYMVLGTGLIDAGGEHHRMAGLLDLETSFETRRLHLGYRNIEATDFAMGDAFKGHEFHYTSATRENGLPLFDITDALGTPLGKAGLRDNSVMGSYMHIIDRAAQ